MTVATDKLVYDISPAKTNSFKLVDQFDCLLKRCTLSGEIMYASLSEATVNAFCPNVPFPILALRKYATS